MPKIIDQSEALDLLDTLSTEATRLEKLAGATAPARPARTDDLLLSLEQMEAYVAVLSVVTRLQSPQPRTIAAHPAPVHLSRLAPASPGTTIRVTGANLTATQRATAALAALPRPTPAKPAAAPAAAPVAQLSATDRCLAVKSKVNPPAASAPVKLTASEKCRAAIVAQAAAKAAKAAVPAASLNPNAPASLQ